MKRMYKCMGFDVEWKRRGGEKIKLRFFFMMKFCVHSENYQSAGANGLCQCNNGYIDLQGR